MPSLSQTDSSWQDLTAPGHWNGGIGVPFPAKAWTVQDGMLGTSTRTWQSLYSKKQYREFELRFEWKLAPGANSGVKYMCAEGMLDPDWLAMTENGPYHIGGIFLFAVVAPLLAWKLLQRLWLKWLWTAAGFVALLVALSGTYLYYQARSRMALIPPGFEYQLIDNAGYRIKLKPAQLTASLYDLIPAPAIPAPPVGQFHESAIVVKGNHVEHWLDGSKIVEFDLGSTALRQAVEGSKFKRLNGFAEPRSGYLQLQAHDGQVWFRNIRIKEQ